MLISCMILQKQIECICGNKENLIIPNVRMRLTSEQRQQSSILQSAPTTVPSPRVLTESISERASAPSANGSSVTDDASTNENSQHVLNPCLMCHQAEKSLACLPCGHLTACMKCGASLRTCPICRATIEAFIRVYL